MSESILSRSSVSQSTFSPLQSEVDGLVGGFVTQATDWRALAAMTAGGGAFRLGRMGVIGSGVLEGSPTLARVASVAAGLGSEVLAFEGTHRSLLQATGEHNPNLLRWEGRGGLRQGLLSSTVTFGALRGAGALAEGQNLVTRHLLQDTAMVAGHNVTGTLGISERPQGSLVQQFLSAEATNLQMEAGFAMLHRVAPGIPALERGLDLSLQSGNRGTFFEGIPSLQNGLEPAMATAGGRSAEAPGTERSPLFNHILMMVKGDRAEDGSAPSSSERPLVTVETESITPRSPAEILRELGRLLSEAGESLEEGKPGVEKTREHLRALGKLAEAHPEVVNEILSLADTVRRYPSIAESLDPVLRTLNQEGRSTKGALGAAQRELKKVIDENPELRRQAENFLRFKHLIPNGMTLAAGLMAIISSVYSLRGEPGTACVLLAVAAVIDKMDGTVARLLRAQHAIGERFDSYADFANYGLASALFTYGVLNHHGEGLLGWGAALTIGAMAMLRLSTFDYLGENPHALPARDILRNPILGHGKDFIGMPSTMMGLILPALYWAFGRNHPDVFFGLSTLSGIAMFSPLRYGKLTDGIMGGIGRRALQTIRNPVKVAVGGATAAILSYLGYRFPEFSIPLAQVGVLGGLGTYVASPFIEAFSRLFTSGNSNNNSPAPPPVLTPPAIDEGAFSSAPPPREDVAAARTPIPRSSRVPDETER